MVRMDSPRSRRARIAAVYCAPWSLWKIAPVRVPPLVAAAACSASLLAEGNSHISEVARQRLCAHDCSGNMPGGGARP